MSSGSDRDVEGDKNQGKPSPVSFFDPSLKQVRWRVTRQWAQLGKALQHPYNVFYSFALCLLDNSQVRKKLC